MKVLYFNSQETSKKYKKKKELEDFPKDRAIIFKLGIVCYSAGGSVYVNEFIVV